MFVALFGCVACSSTASRLKVRFSQEQGCPVDQVGVVDENGADYHASGCGKETDYVCGAIAGIGDSAKGCSVRGLNPHEPSGQPPHQNALDTRPDLEGPK